MGELLFCVFKPYTWKIPQKSMIFAKYTANFHLICKPYFALSAIPVSIKLDLGRFNWFKNVYLRIETFDLIVNMI